MGQRRGTAAFVGATQVCVCTEIAVNRTIWGQGTLLTQGPVGEQWIWGSSPNEKRRIDVELSKDAVDLDIAGLLASLSSDDLLPGLRAVVSEGWEVRDGAVLLRRWFKSYHGDRALFVDLTSYESAVNGRGIPEDGLDRDTESLTRELMRRGLAFAWAALAEATRTHPDRALIAFVYVNPTLYDSATVSGFVTFCAVHEGERTYLDVENIDTGVFAALESNDCREVLPAGSQGRSRRLFRRQRL